MAQPPMPRVIARLSWRRRPAASTSRIFIGGHGLRRGDVGGGRRVVAALDERRVACLGPESMTCRTATPMLVALTMRAEHLSKTLGGCTCDRGRHDWLDDRDGGRRAGGTGGGWSATGSDGPGSGSVLRHPLRGPALRAAPHAAIRAARAV